MNKWEKRTYALIANQNEKQSLFPNPVASPPLVPRSDIK
jgi:hypothetical protein